MQGELFGEGFVQVVQEPSDLLEMIWLGRWWWLTVMEVQVLPNHVKPIPWHVFIELCTEQVLVLLPVIMMCRQMILPSTCRGLWKFLWWAHLLGSTSVLGDWQPAVELHTFGTWHVHQDWTVKQQTWLEEGFQSYKECRKFPKKTILILWVINLSVLRITGLSLWLCAATIHHPTPERSNGWGWFPQGAVRLHPILRQVVKSFIIHSIWNPTKSSSSDLNSCSSQSFCLTVSN